MKLTSPESVTTPAALIVIPVPSTSVVYAPVVKGIVTLDGVEPDGSWITSVTACPVWLIFTVSVPITVMPGMPTNEAVPLA